jgi:acyl dehydratase
MSLDELNGRRYGPVHVRMSAGRVAAYVASTGDDPSRWASTAPPSFAAALLFAVAPAFLTDPVVAGERGSLLHGEQTFRWHRPLDIGAAVFVTGEVARIRTRGDATFVTFVVSVAGDGPVVDGTSLFIIAAGAVASDVPEEEPVVDARGRTERPEPLELPAAGEPIDPLRKSASRADLVRYAGASHDWNPIHWDHTSAVGAGLRGVIVHGLLSAAWVTQAAVRYTHQTRPLSEARFRFQVPLRPAVGTLLGGEVRSVHQEGARLRVVLESEEGVHVTSDLAVTL